MKMKGTTILAVRKDGKVAIGGDGQISFSDTIMKQRANKIRRIYEGKVLAGFSGALADAFTLFEKFETKIKEYKGNLKRASVELAKEWRTDKFLRRLEALLAVCDKNCSLLISGSGEVIEPDDDILAIGSGGAYALAAARALMSHSDLSAREIVEESLKIAGSICLYTNTELTIEEL
jgi:ATP-dependent HslUV protease subunit HslV